MTANLRDLKILSTARVTGNGLLLRPWDPDSGADVEAWLRGNTDPEFRRWNTPITPVTDRAAAEDSLRVRTARALEGSAASFVIEDAGSGTPLGHIGINDIRPFMATARVGYWVLPEARGHGVATRALGLVADWGFGELGLHRMELDHAVGHEVSCRVAERCGFRYEGTMRGAVFQAGRKDAWRDAHLHARLATDPAPKPHPKR
ncbi:GNAT family N-acetyltransferase [Streptomyces naganishii]|uniref:Acetyltransferase n=1 Tax=Streptomyces naganishii JCM 4654 TaxID=1306179 RepID=A0A918Y7A9_9ACTN|nr:GNAT family N-acetyltransferase [Streptomyces naganishii]GHD91559.1 acetyltransferase [Streptomyces naganishii JCM 4654]